MFKPDKFNLTCLAIFVISIIMIVIGISIGDAEAQHSNLIYQSWIHPHPIIYPQSRVISEVGTFQIFHYDPENETLGILDTRSGRAILHYPKEHKYRVLTDGMVYSNKPYQYEPSTIKPKPGPEPTPADEQEHSILKNDK